MIPKGFHFGPAIRLALWASQGVQRRKRKGRAEFVDQMASGGRGMSAAALNENREKWVVMFRDSLRRDFDRKSVKPDANDCWSWSMWSG